MPGQHRQRVQLALCGGATAGRSHAPDLAILATGLYGQALPPQDGAPLRLVVPWKYGFKSIKAIVKIDLVDQPPTSCGWRPPRTSMVSTPT